MDRVLLDANVLFSAAYQADAFLAGLWRVPDCRLLASGYAIGEARRNLATPEQLARLGELLATVEQVADADPALALPAGVALPAKDVPILLAAIAANATHLLTGDVRHFGSLYGTTVAGVLIERPASYLRCQPLP